MNKPKIGDQFKLFNTIYTVTGIFQGEKSLRATAPYKNDSDGRVIYVVEEDYKFFDWIETPFQDLINKFKEQFKKLFSINSGDEEDWWELFHSSMKESYELGAMHHQIELEKSVKEASDQFKIERINRL